METGHLMVRASYPVLEVKDQSMDFGHCICFFRRNWKMNPCPQSLTIGPPFIGYNHRIGINHLIHSLEISSLLKSAIGLALARIIRALPSLLTSGPNSTAISTFFLLPLERPTAPGSNPPITVSSASTSPASDSTSKADMACWTFRLKNHAVS
jgi:hypothetical protein